MAASDDMFSTDGLDTTQNSKQVGSSGRIIWTGRVNLLYLRNSNTEDSYPYISKFIIPRCWYPLIHPLIFPPFPISPSKSNPLPPPCFNLLTSPPERSKTYRELPSLVSPHSTVEGTISSLSSFPFSKYRNCATFAKELAGGAVSR